MFAIRNKKTGEFAGWKLLSEYDGDDQPDDDISISFQGHVVAIFTEREQAVRAMGTKPKWYNDSSFETPNHAYDFQDIDKNDLEVVELIVKEG